MIVFSLVGSASALYLEYHYFETDKLVYEVGETIDMVARLIADYGAGGWAYVSFGVVTDQGPVFSEGYFISPSPNVRYLTSSYQILPDDTMPGENGTSASVIFSIEVFESFSQVAGDTIMVNITRGHLEAIPQTPFSLEHGDNTTLRILVSSIHNSTIILPDTPVSISIINSTQHIVFENNTATDQEGVLSVTWNEQWGPPGDYNLSLNTNETHAFHSLTETLTVTVTPPSSTLIVTSSPNTVYCQTPDGSHTESIDIEVEHTSRSLAIDDSVVEWQSPFGSGNLTSQGSGRYRGTIPFNTSPGHQTINLSAINTNYQTAYSQKIIEVLQRESTVSIDVSESPLSGHNITIDVTATDWSVDYDIESAPVTINLTIGFQNFTTQGFTNSSGQFEWTLSIPIDAWGDGNISVTISSTTYYIAAQNSTQIDVSYIPEMNYEVISPLILGETAEVRIIITDPILQTIDSLTVELRNSSGSLLTTGVTDSSGQTILTWTIISSSSVGVQDFTVFVSEDGIRYISNKTTIVQLSIYHPLFFLPSQSSYTVMRGENITLSYVLDSQWAGNQSLNILINDTMNELIIPVSNSTNQQIYTTITIDNSISLGIHALVVQIDSPLFIPLGVFRVYLTVMGTLSIEISPDTAYYGEGFDMSLQVSDDTNTTPTFISIRAMIGAAYTEFAVFNNVTPESITNITLPSWVSPGLHPIIIEISGHYLLAANESFDLMVWMQTRLTISIVNLDRGNGTDPVISQSFMTEGQDPITSIISSGLIMSPPPIFCNGITFTEPVTARETSLESCPRFISGTSNLSTVPANSRTASSGKGHSVFIRNDLKGTELPAIASSTDREVHPNETTPQAAFDGPSITKSVKKLLASRTFAVIL